MEKRRFQRYEHQLEVEYSPCNNGLVYSSTRTKNISRGGICIPCLSRLVRTGEPIKVDIYPSHESREYVSAIGEVVWTKETNGNSSHAGADAEAGIMFTKVDPALLERVLENIPGYTPDISAE